MPHLMSARGELQSEQFQPKGFTTLWDLTLAQAGSEQVPLPPPPFPGVGALRACLEQCQTVEGKSPEECQDRCRALTPGETGTTDFWQNFIQGFKIPGKELSSVMVVVLAAILIIVALALLTR